MWNKEEIEKNNPIRFYKCGRQQSLLVEEKVCIDAGCIVEKNFICMKCFGMVIIKSFSG